jgi:hypothetical protein
MPLYELRCRTCDRELSHFAIMAEAPIWNQDLPDICCGAHHEGLPGCPGALYRPLTLPQRSIIHEGEPIYEQGWRDNGDGKTLTVEPLARNLRDGHRKIIPKKSSMIRP